jgi:hypothetical protein
MSGARRVSSRTSRPSEARIKRWWAPWYQPMRGCSQWRQRGHRVRSSIRRPTGDPRALCPASTLPVPLRAGPQAGRHAPPATARARPSAGGQPCALGRNVVRGELPASGSPFFCTLSRMSHEESAGPPTPRPRSGVPCRPPAAVTVRSADIVSERVRTPNTRPKAVSRVRCTLARRFRRLSPEKRLSFKLPWPSKGRDTRRRWCCVRKRCPS